MKKTRALLSVLFNLATVVLTVYSVCCYIVRGATGNMFGMGSQCFIFYTTDSNVLAALCCLPALFFSVKALLGGEIREPRWARVLKWVGTSCVMLTFLVVVCFLSLFASMSALFEGPNLFLHGVCPLLCLFSFLFFEEGDLPWKDLPFVLLPTVVYGLVYFVMVVIVGAEKGGWVDFYHFNLNGMWYVAMAAVFAGAALIAVVLRLLARLTDRK